MIRKAITSLIIVGLTALFACNQSVSKKDELQTNTAHVQLTLPTKHSTGKIFNLIHGCGYTYQSLQKNININLPSPDNLEDIKRIVEYSGIPMSFKVYTGNVKNAIATIIDSVRYIVYNPKLLKNTDESSITYWRSMSIIAHEIGHHLAGHTLTEYSDQVKAELEADKYSGFVLYRLGASLDEAISAISEIADKDATQTHPAQSARKKAVTEGWNTANTLRYKTVIPPPPKDLLNVEKGIGEFDKKNFYGNETYESYRKKSGNGVYVSPKLIGTVIDSDTSGVTIYVTGNVSKWIKDSTDVIGQILSMTYEHDRFNYARRSWFNLIMVPGRKIIFAYDEGGSGRFQSLIYMKYLSASGKLIE